MIECNWDAFPYYQKIIVPIKVAAKKLGYCIAQHGTLKRDVDLIAIPWTENAVDAFELAAAIRKTIEEVLEISEPSMMQDAVWKSCEQHNIFEGRHRKPHGRLVWNYYFTPECDGPYLDLGIMPRITNESA